LVPNRFSGDLGFVPFRTAMAKPQGMSFYFDGAIATGPATAAARSKPAA